MKRHYPLPILLSVCLQLWGVLAAAEETWRPGDFALEMGSAVPQAGGLHLSPNESGQVYIALPPRSTDLAQQHLLDIEFADSPPQVIFLIWNNDIEPQQLYQFRLPPQQQNPVVFDMSGVKGWDGRATRLGIGLRLRPEQQVVLRSVSLDSPTLLTPVGKALRNWSHFRPWKQVDINVYTGTRKFGEGPHPAPVFALLCLFGLVLYFAFARIGRRRFSVGVAGTIVLGAWLMLDLFWQLRLWQQVPITLKQFGGLNSDEKLLASSDADLIGFVTAARQKITDEEARVFVASANDGMGMRSAYYISPLNTYWHRKGPELPPPEQLNAGDYLLVIAPSAVRYNPDKGSLRYGTTDPVTIETVHRDRQGLLLRVTR